MYDMGVIVLLQKFQFAFQQVLFFFFLLWITVMSSWEATLQQWHANIKI